MGLFSRKQETPAETRLPAPEEIAAAGRALGRDNNKKPAERLCAEAGPYSRSVAMNILSVSADYTPPDN
ncbi:hypothetical protein [Streptomyces sp. NPDC006267]|uniref:hypothetical protein n=1 Tax=Streptomyces sp. NPDC006267 TaxID=3157173 RepID=UPI0033BDDE70